MNLDQTRTLYEGGGILADFAGPRYRDFCNLMGVWIGRINVESIDGSDSMVVEAEITAVCLAESPDGLDGAISKALEPHQLELTSRTCFRKLDEWLVANEPDAALARALGRLSRNQPVALFDFRTISLHEKTTGRSSSCCNSQHQISVQLMKVGKGTEAFAPEVAVEEMMNECEKEHTTFFEKEECLTLKGAAEAR